MKRIIQGCTLVLVMFFLASCATTQQGPNFANGVYSETMPVSSKDAYDATMKAIETGQTYSNDGAYQIEVNSFENGEGKVRAVNPRDRRDYLIVNTEAVSADESKVYVKYGSGGNQIRSSALIPIIKKNL